MSDARRRLTPLCVAALGSTAISLVIVAGALSVQRDQHDHPISAGDREFIATGLRTLYWAEQTERVSAYSEHVARVDTYLRTAARIDAYLHAVAWLDAASRAGAAEAAEPTALQASRAAAVRPSPPAPAAAPLAVMTDAAFAAEVFRLLNARRQRAGLPTLAIDASLQRAASGHAMRMLQSGTFSHLSPDGTTFGTRIIAAGYPANRWMGEVIATGSGIGPGQVVTMWMQSAPHQQQIVGTMYVAAGAGCASDGIEVRCVVDFGG